MHNEHFLERMAIGKDNAKRDRDRGGSAVQVYKTTAALHKAQGLSELEDLELGYKTWRDGWKLDCWYAVEYALFGDGWEGL